MTTSISKNGAGMPPTRRSRQAASEPRMAFLEASVMLDDGRFAVEHDERNDAAGRKAMDAWCWKRNEAANVSYIAVEPTRRRAGYKG